MNRYATHLLLDIVRKVLSLLLPLATILLAAPAMGVLIFGMFGGVNGFILLVNVGVVLGLLAAPGYLFAVFRTHGLARVPPGQRVWIARSLIAASLACVIALPFTAVAWQLALLPLATLGLCLERLHHCRAVWRRG
ncbi:MAG TPA: hypothetical protein VFP58_03250 [Candidatus Eisenbacteria bacterium]|nr:hypothetical protein [Candidatus Eisenbacteria bacterium]